MHRRKHLTLKTKTVIIVIFTVFIFVLTTGGIVTYNVAQIQQQNIKNEITSTANIIISNNKVQSQLASKRYPTQTNYLQNYANRILKASKMDFIVILNNNYIRYSHPYPSYIGKKFSSIKDAKLSSTGSKHYSHRKGILGTGYRIFEPIFYHHHQIGLVCVGLTDKSIFRAIWQTENSIITCSLIALLIGISLAILLTNHIKETLFGMEPREIATKLTELYAITNSTNEALLAINPQGIIITANQLAKKLFPSIKIGTKMQPTLLQAIFPKEIHNNLINEIVLISSKEFVVSTNALVYRGTTYGRMALLRDQSDYQKLSEQLAGTQQYIQALRAQSHEFMNKLQTIYGLIELKQYSEVDKFIQKVNQSYQQEFGQLNQQVGSPALAGFLIGKIRQAQEEQISLQVSADTFLPQEIVTEQLNLDLIKVLGNLIDNSLDAIKNTGKITVAINYDQESGIIVIEVSDNGHGISASTKQHILKGKYSTKGQDHGYGLMLIKQIIKVNNGFWDISLKPPHGTTIYIELPVKHSEDNDVTNINC